MFKSAILPLLTLAFLLSVDAPLYSQGRGVPRGPSPQGPSQGRFPGFPPNAGAGRPDAIPPPNTNANPRALEPSGQPITTGVPVVTDQLVRTPRLAERLAGQLGVDVLTTEPEGFRNLGQFVAAVQVSSNVEGTTFDGLKTRMLGDETTDAVSLGEAIQAETALSAEEAAAAAETAEQQAQDVIDETS